MHATIGIKAYQFRYNRDALDAVGRVSRSWWESKSDHFSEVKLFAADYLSELTGASSSKFTFITTNRKVMLVRFICCGMLYVQARSRFLFCTNWIFVRKGYSCWPAKCVGFF